MSFTFKHPKYYTELRKLRNKSDQAISESKTVDIGDSVRPGPGPKHQASSRKRQAPRFLIHEKVSRYKDQGPLLG